MNKTACPNCRRSNFLSRRVAKGTWLTCPHCGAGLCVAFLDPPMLTRAPSGLSVNRVANWPLDEEHKEL
jgi:ribosomal protein L37AE/L43A